jgi:hypothetical protein
MSMKCKQLIVFVALLVLGSTVAHADLVGHWKFDEGAGTVAVDSSGNGNDGTFTGAPQYVPGQLGTALQFDGDDWVDCGDALDLTNELSIACWINPSGLAGDNGWVARWDNYAFKSSGTSVRFTTPGVLDYTANNATLVVGEWQHVAVTFVPSQTDGAIFYLQGVEAQRINSTGYGAGGGPLAIGNNRWSQFYEGMIDDVQVYDHILTPDEVAGAMAGLDPPGLAVDPSPGEEAIDVPREVTLSWTPGEFAVKHTVYLGTRFEDVNDGSAAVMIADNIDDATVDAGVLDFDQTYYWRVDEVNGAPDRTVFTGNVWSFTVEPKGIPIETITATASAANPNMGPENTINGSGMNELDQHSADPLTMWLAQGPNPWIQYEFDTAYKLHELLVWNSNQVIEAFIGFGAKEVTIETSIDGENWTALDGVIELAKATGQPTYEANTTVEFGGIMAQFVKISVVSAHGLTGQAGLAEVRFLALPVVAREPQPADGSTADTVDVQLSWRSGREAATHEVYFGPDADNLALLDTTNEATAATDPLDYMTTYTWSVTEVNDTADPAAHAGEAWTFTTPDYGIVDDFESYSGDEGEEVFMAWFDGFGGDASLGGSTTGHIDGPFVETSNVNSGSQSMPVYIDNDGGFFDIDGKTSSPNFSEVVRDLDTQDWTASGIKTLSIMFAGSTGLTGQLYCKIGSSKITYDGDAANLSSSAWQAWNIDLSTVGGNLTSVRELAIGVEGGTSGILFIDDIRLFTRIGELIIPAEPTTGLVAHYTFENNANDVSGNGHNGTVNGNAPFATGKIGSALDCDGVDDYVSTDKSAAQLGIDGNKPRTVSSWVYTRAYNNGGIYDVGARAAAQDFCLRTMATENLWRIQYWGGDSDFTYDTINKWVHFTHVHDGERTKIYADGMLIVDWEKTVDTSNTNPFQIGCYGWQVDFFNGMIDEVRVYNRALTAEEALWLAGKTQPVHKPF